VSYINLAQWFNAQCDAFEDRTAFNCAGLSVEYSELQWQASLFAAWLMSIERSEKSLNDISLNTSPQRRVAVLLPNMLQYPVVVYGIWLADCTLVNINPSAKEREIHEQLKDSGADIIIYLDLCSQHLLAAINTLNIKQLVKVQLSDMQSLLRHWLIRFASSYQLRGVPKDPEHVVLLSEILTDSVQDSTTLGLKSCEDMTNPLAMIQYTMGTTGRAKGVCLSHHNLLANIEQVSFWLAEQHKFDDKSIKVIAPLPLYHIYSFTAHLLVLFSQGATSYLVTDPTRIENIVSLFKRYRINAMTGIERLFAKLLQDKAFLQCDLSHLRLVMSGGAPLLSKTSDLWFQKTSISIMQGYGMTELSPVIAMSDQYSVKGSVGQAVFGTEISIRNQHNQRLQCAEIGEIYVKGPQCFNEYWQSPETTQLNFYKDWFRTGDMGYISDTNELFIADRKKDLILVSGFNVYPNEIENVVLKFDHITQAVAVGVEHPDTGEAVKVIFVSTSSIDIAKLEAYCRTQLSGYKIPKFWQSVDELPVSAVGKILRRKFK
jgi:long-chain acyl-CoA synthetase